MPEFSELQQTAWDISEAHGHHEAIYRLCEDNPPLIDVVMKLSLVMEEVVEAQRYCREVDSINELLLTSEYDENGRPDGFAAELADIVIRVMDLAQNLDINLSNVIIDKNQYNETRSFRNW
jgi:NTP pyrophosphatase (non-canonical NTP hydrolase)